MIDPIALEGQRRQFQLLIDPSVTTGTGSEAIALNLDFSAAMVLVDNFSNQYIYFQDAQTWVPPQTQGYRLLMPTGGTRSARAQVNTPPGITAAARSTGQIISVTFLEKAIITSSITQSITTIVSSTIGGTGIMTGVSVTTVGAGTANTNSAAVAAVAGLRLMGWSIRENAGAAAEVVIHSGTSTAGQELMRRTFAASESITDWLGPQGLAASQGIFVERVAGASVIEIYSLAQT